MVLLLFYDIKSLSCLPLNYFNYQQDKDLADWSEYVIQVEACPVNKASWQKDGTFERLRQKGGSTWKT